MNDTFRSALVLSVNLNRYAPKVATHIEFVLMIVKIYPFFFNKSISVFPAIVDVNAYFSLPSYDTAGHSVSAIPQARIFLLLACYSAHSRFLALPVSLPFLSSLSPSCSFAHALSLCPSCSCYIAFSRALAPSPDCCPCISKLFWHVIKWAVIC